MLLGGCRGASVLSDLAGSGYHGHEGIRRWIADLSDSAYAFVEHATDVRRVASGRIGVFGHVLAGERRIGPFSMLLSMRDGKIAETHAYLSHEAELRRIGHLPG